MLVRGGPRTHKELTRRTSRHILAAHRARPDKRQARRGRRLRQRAGARRHDRRIGRLAQRAAGSGRQAADACRATTPVHALGDAGTALGPQRGNRQRCVRRRRRNHTLGSRRAAAQLVDGGLHVGLVGLNLGAGRVEDRFGPQGGGRVEEFGGEGRALRDRKCGSGGRAGSGRGLLPPGVLTSRGARHIFRVGSSLLVFHPRTPSHARSHTRRHATPNSPHH